MLGVLFLSDTIAMAAFGTATLSLIYAFICNRISIKKSVGWIIALQIYLLSQAFIIDCVILASEEVSILQRALAFGVYTLYLGTLLVQLLKGPQPTTTSAAPLLKKISRNTLIIKNMCIEFLIDYNCFFEYNYYIKTLRRINMSTVGSTTTATTTPSIEQSSPSKLTTFTRLACGVTSIGVIAAEVIRRLNSEVEIVPFANEYLPAPTTNLMIASTAIAIFGATFMLSCENTAQPKNQEALKPEELKSPFVTKSEKEVKEIHETSYLYLAFFTHFMEIQPQAPHVF